MSESKMFKGEMESVETLETSLMQTNSNIQHRLHWFSLEFGIACAYYELLL